MTTSPLVDARTLAAHLDDAAWVVVDCRFSLADTGAGRRDWAAGHIPGARYAHLDEDLSGPRRADSGRHPLPDPAAFAACLGRFGITPDSQVVAYDAAGGAMAAARLWWLLRWFGHARAAVLDGGLAAWLRAGLPLATDTPAPQPTVYPPTPDDHAWLPSACVPAALALGERLIDARAAARFRGEVEPIDPVAGHIPGAVNLPHEGNLDADGRFLPPERLRERFAAVLGGAVPATVIHSCGSGVTACHNLLAMEVAGLHGSRLYAGSWSEWVRDPARPVATGG